MKTDDILVSHWGYEQTNVDYYQVISATAKTVTLRKINKIKSDNSHDMTGLCAPQRGSFAGDPFRRKILDYNGEFVGLNSYSTARVWNGQLDRYTTYA